MATSDYDEQLDRIAEYADASVRTLSRQGSLVFVPGSYGLKRWLYARWGNRGNAVYTATGSLFAIGLSGFWAWAFDEPLLFPSLGATAFLFFETPLAEVGDAAERRDRALRRDRSPPWSRWPRSACWATRAPTWRA